MNRWLFTCEHGGNRVPEPWRHLFAEAQQALQSHRGWDAGALCVFRKLEQQLADYALASETTRLLVDLNRSTHHRALFSEFTRHLPQAERQRILHEHYTPWRETVTGKIQRWQRRNETVLHISFHSFAPELNGKLRSTDIGLLYDPGRAQERAFCRRWQAQLKALAPDLRIHLNRPYRGTADGFTTALRRRFPEGYAGIELEMRAPRVDPQCEAIASLIESSLLPLKGN